MTTFVHVNQPLTHTGVRRSGDPPLLTQASNSKARGLAALLLGAIVSALVVVADRIVVNLADGGLLLGWVVLWGLAFVATALLADTARSLSLRVTAALGRWRHTPRVDPDASLATGRRHRG